MYHEIATHYFHKLPDMGILLILFPGLTIQMHFGRCQRLWTAPDLQYLVVPPITVGLVLKLYFEGSEILAQFSVANPLPDDLNNVSVVHFPTSFSSSSTALTSLLTKLLNAIALSFLYWMVSIVRLASLIYCSCMETFSYLIRHALMSVLPSSFMMYFFI